MALGLITQVYPGTDNVIRFVRVRTQKNTIYRSVQSLFLLEVHYWPDFGGGAAVGSGDEGDVNNVPRDDQIPINTENEIDDVEPYTSNVNPITQDSAQSSTDTSPRRTKSGRLVKRRQILVL